MRIESVISSGMRNERRILNELTHRLQACEVLRCGDDDLDLSPSVRAAVAELTEPLRGFSAE